MSVYFTFFIPIRGIWNAFAPNGWKAWVKVLVVRERGTLLSRRGGHETGKGRPTYAESEETGAGIGNAKQAGVFAWTSPGMCGRSD